VVTVTGRRWLPVAGAVLAVGVLGAGVGALAQDRSGGPVAARPGPSGPTGAGPSSAPPTQVPNSVAPAPPNCPLGLPTGEASCGRARTAPAGVERVEVLADGRTLQVTTYHGVCPDVPNVVSAQEAADRVVLRVATPRRSGGEVCVTLAKAQTSTVRLSAPLGSRRLVDGQGRPVHDVRRR